MLLTFDSLSYFISHEMRCWLNCEFRIYIVRSFLEHKNDSWLAVINKSVQDFSYWLIISDNENLISDHVNQMKILL